MKLTRITMTALLAAALGGGFAHAQDEPLSEAGKEAVESTNRFGFDLYRQLAKTEDGNLFFSPYSVSAAMGMAYAGAEGETRAQIKRAMHFGGDVAQGQGDLDQALAGSKQAAVKPGQHGSKPATKPAQDGMAQGLTPKGAGDLGNPWDVDDLDAMLEADAADHSVAAAGAKEEKRVAPNHVVRVANRAWPQVDFPIKDSYLRALAPYRVGVEPLDFAADPDAAKDRINAWVADQTRNAQGKPMIPELLAELDDTARLVLTNAIYFRGEWQTAFDEAETRKGPFHKLDGSSALVDMMNLSHADVPVGQLPTSKARIGVLPYKAHGAELVVVLPLENTPASLSAAEAELSAAAIAAALAPGYVMEDSDLAFPKFEIEGEFQLQEALEALGVTDAFSEARADFRGIATSSSGKNLLHVAAVVHKAVASFNEQGAEAAAATAVVLGLESMSMGFRVDRPFVFLIRDTQTGTILFMGRVLDPTE